MYISEPFKEKYEIESLKYLLKTLDSNYFSFSSKIFIKLHPKDTKTKYDNIIKSYKHKLNIIISDEFDAVELLNKCKWIIGLTSYLLFMSARLNKMTYHCKLPNQKNIKLLKNKKIKSFHNLKLK